MPRYEFYCEDCKKPFEAILTLAEYEKGKIKCPKSGRAHIHQEAACVLRRHFQEKLSEIHGGSVAYKTIKSQFGRF